MNRQQTSLLVGRIAAFADAAMNAAGKAADTARDETRDAIIKGIMSGKFAGTEAVGGHLYTRQNKVCLSIEHEIPLSKLTKAQRAALDEEAYAVTVKVPDGLSNLHYIRCTKAAAPKVQKALDLIVDGVLDGDASALAVKLDALLK